MKVYGVMSALFLKPTELTRLRDYGLHVAHTNDEDFQHALSETTISNLSTVKKPDGDVIC